MRYLPALLFAFYVAATPLTAQEYGFKERAAEALEALKRDARQASDTAVRKARKAWEATQDRVTTDPAEYRRLADQRLNELSEEIAAIQRHSAGEIKQRPYLEPRHSALQQHLAFVETEFKALPTDATKPGYDAQRRACDRTLKHLEHALDQAAAELDDRG